ncbi:MAG TPA: DHH family phosphoesterase [Candidatus Nanoperiomorbaceae bacterium]|nr:DHH family phosphoesterase [Candidatus Nanoperiomorbaceae bacterium]HMQ96555.1 DHH family phosphoesterase [Candidatus Nanoperiomorbaceae bacterium]HMR86349.1 DHH family phosphoesterase [Candidatus Nanoperiomorbaceae bacterium]HMU12253.1 DHH family phosphoesterase [Candidatus Nanoperiomorbaceae bacterium]
MKIVTSGAKYIDIDAYAGCAAYAELLRLKGEDSVAVCTASPNESVSNTVRSWNAPIENVYEPSENDEYILIDISDPEYFDEIVNLERVGEVIDHHPGLEQYWHEKIGDKAIIEFIGAACTLVYDSWKSSGLLDKMSVTSARLLICGILDNTLNFGAKVTTPRDVEAYNELLKIARLPDDFTARYFTECQNAILQNLVVAIQNDTKILQFRTFARPMGLGQLVVWDSSKILTGSQHVIAKTLSAIKPDWLMNLVNLSEGKSYFIAENVDVQNWLENLLKVKFNNHIAVADRLWLRKEIIKQDIEQS